MPEVKMNITNENIWGWGFRCASSTIFGSSTSSIDSDKKRRFGGTKAARVELL